MPRKRTPTTSPRDDESWRRQFAGDLETSRARFRTMADLVLKHADAHLLNHTSYGMSIFLFIEAGINCDWVEKELEEERLRVERRSQLSIVARK